MKKCIVVIEDKKAGTFENPICFPNVVIANRYFCQLYSNKETNIAKWPEDFRLVKIADYNEQNGEINPHKPIIIIEAVAFKENK